MFVRLGVPELSTRLLDALDQPCESTAHEQRVLVAKFDAAR